MTRGTFQVKGLEPSCPLPNGWRWARLGEVARYVNGRAFRPDEWGDAGLPIIRIQNLTSPEVPFNYFAGAAETRHQVHNGDLLISWSASLDAFIWDRGPALLNQHIFKAEENRNLICREYLYFVAKYAMEDLRTRVHGATMRHVTRPEFEATLVPLPPLVEQQRIIALLDAQMAEVERARAAAEARWIASGLLAEAWLRGTFDRPAARAWRARRIGEFADTCSGTTPARGRRDYYGGTIPWTRTTELRDGVITETEERITELALRECRLTVLPRDTLLIAMYGQGQTRGRTAVLGVPATVNQACFAILPNPSVFDSKFLQLWFRRNYKRLRAETEGRGGNQPNLNGLLLRDQVVALPPVDEQKRIIGLLQPRLDDGVRLARLLEDELSAIKELPELLLRRAFSGEL